MNAKEMFSNASYYRNINDKSGVLYTHRNNENFGIGFRYGEKSIVILNTQKDANESWIDMEVYKAITQQLKELGWLND